MSDVLIDQDTMEDIGDSIRSNLGVQTTYLPSEMPNAIMSISGGGSGGSAKYSETVLWSGTQSTTGTITLSESIKNFSIIMLMISAHPNNTNYYKTPWYILVSEITDYTTTYQFEPFGVRGAENVNDRACMLSLHFANETSITIDEVSHGSQAKATLLKVIGIKWETMQTALIYSEEEREVGVWTDGKPLYQKSWLLNLPSSMRANTGVKFTEASIPELDAVANVEWSIYYSDKYIGNPVNIFWYSQAQIGYSGQQADGVEFFFGGSYYANQKLLYTCRYTKTTDTPGSGIWTTTGEYAHHYSTDEKVVGTWIDGKTLYEITITGNFSGTTFNFDTGITEMRPKIVNISYNRPDAATPATTWIYDTTYFKMQYINNGIIILNKSDAYAYGTNNNVIINILYTKE